jgi:hypothetical protein
MTGKTLINTVSMIITVIIVQCLISNIIYAVSIDINGSWTETVNKYNLAAGTGSDLPNQIESSQDGINVDITFSTSADDSWRVDARRSDTNWNSDLGLFIRRSNDGVTGVYAGSISEGTVYQELMNTDRHFFSGSGDRINVNLQFMITGMSLKITPGTYTTVLYLTVVDY